MTDNPTVPDGGELNEFDRAEFEQEFDSWEEFIDYLDGKGYAYSGSRIRVGEFVIQDDPDGEGFQVAKREYKGNTARGLFE